jgi:hypothetical protein
MNEEEDRIRTNITLSREVFNMACDYKINLSSFLENQLIQYFDMRQKIFDYGKTQYPTSTKYTTNTHFKQQRQSQKVTQKSSKMSLQQGRCGYRDSNPSDWLGKPIS